MKLILSLMLSLGALSFNAQDPPHPPTLTGSDATPLSRAQIQARIELNEAARAYREGAFAEAQRHTEAAQSLDPLNKTAALFLARIIHRQYKPGDQSPENLEKAHAAMGAYRRILIHDPQNDEAYKAIVSLYGAIKEEDLQRQWILQRAVDATFSPQQRAEAYIVLASRDWHCSNVITDLPTNKAVWVDDHRKATVIYTKPKDEAEFQKAKQCLASGLEKIEMAIVLAPQSEAAWSYKTNLLLEGAKLAEMEDQADRKTDFEQQAHEAQRRAEELSQKQREQNLRDDNLTVRPEAPPKTKKQEEPKS